MFDALIKNSNINKIELLKSILNDDNAAKLVKEILSMDHITTSDIVNIGYRKKQLDIFYKLLAGGEWLLKYKEWIKRFLQKDTEIKDEKAWQYFFKNNEQIFGYGLSYKFYSILQDEFHASDTIPSGAEGVISDFLLADNNYTVIVEIKKPDTPLFRKNQQNRANSWKLSNELIESYSQILEQKASAQIKFETNQSKNFDLNSKLITQKMYDPKCLLIIGNLTKELNCINDKEKMIKQKTFELFRRDSRNIEIITYDKLYDRAKFIITNSK